VRALRMRIKLELLEWQNFESFVHYVKVSGNNSKDRYYYVISFQGIKGS